MSNQVYDILKYLALVAIPALSTLISAIAVIWQVPHCDQVVATLTAINTFVGALVVYNKSKWDKEHKDEKEE